MLELVRAMQDGVCDHPDAEQLMLELAVQLGTVKGKKSYGYLPKRLKNLVDEIVDEMERLPVVSKCYDQWLMLQGKVESRIVCANAYTDELIADAREAGKKLAE